MVDRQWCWLWTGLRPTAGLARSRLGISSPACTECKWNVFWDHPRGQDPSWSVFLLTAVPLHFGLWCTRWAMCFWVIPLLIGFWWAVWTCSRGVWAGQGVCRLLADAKMQKRVMIMAEYWSCTTCLALAMPAGMLWVRDYFDLIEQMAVEKPSKHRAQTQSKRVAEARFECRLLVAKKAFWNLSDGLLTFCVDCVKLFSAVLWETEAVLKSYMC